MYKHARHLLSNSANKFSENARTLFLQCLVGTFFNNLPKIALLIALTILLYIQKSFFISNKHARNFHIISLLHNK